MLLAKLKERWMSKNTDSLVDLEKRARLFRLLQRFAPVLSFVLFFIGIIWILILPYDGYSKGTYISENALLPGQANVEYGYNDIKTAEDYIHKLSRVQDKDSETRAQFIQKEFRLSGFVSAVQHFTFDNNGYNTKGANAFAIHKAPRSDGKEALILSAPWVSRTGEYNTNGIALLLSLAKLFKRNVYWAKDIILLVTDQGKAGTQAWLDAYHGMEDGDEFSAIVMPRSGTIQGAVNLDFPGTQDYETLGIFFEGVNGQLPNLDLINTIVAVVERSNLPIAITLHDTTKHPFSDIKDNEYLRSLFNMLNSMRFLVLGHPSSDAGLYLRYRIDAVTIHVVLEGTQSKDVEKIAIIDMSFVRLPKCIADVILNLYIYSLVLYYLGTTPIITNLSEKEKTVLATLPAKKHHHLFALTILIITHAAGVIIFNIIQPSFAREYLARFPGETAIGIQFGASLVTLSPSGLATLFGALTETSLVHILSTLLFDYQTFGSWFLTYTCIVYWPINMAMIALVFTQTLS
ncbi:hypothetical protein G6F46_005036 [Rhizopus delemar]|uniref:Uncharacterized protein n=2 Tax=Rhizopus TaxID=4842 RepID=A0A9P6Z5Q5_9FUNG|nr:hypothetical protein G6F55_003343 [Rhizopus delemar]KAG1545968.1 hypothetical protein G6F51_005154 [Rhizopus arrhizus]KAG1499874.1 hypothetical protein G6F54_004104 [Rhizopus delemar]KAG1513250.1 hypothetical protein G6F53_004578 [Rhizopus delemar]KAG1527687.1 hypothetical protein G6F52_001319 [Rhizopus delemar]